MPRKKAAIEDLIKGDMSRRAIGEARPQEAGEGLFPPPAAPASDAAQAQGLAKPARPAPSRAAREGSAALAAFVDALAKSEGIADGAELEGLLDFLKGQAARYVTGLKAGRRFRGQ